jgi:flagellar biosynthesis GTPase FlhF
MAPTIGMSQGASSTTPSPTRVLKRKAVTEKALFGPNKRLKNTLDNSNFAQAYQQEEQKIRDELPIRSDILAGTVVPPKALPKTVKSKWGGKTQADDDQTYRWMQRNADKDQVRKNKHISQALRDKAVRSFPKLEAKKQEEKQARAHANAEFKEEISEQIESYRKEIRMEKKYNCEDKTDLRMYEFMYRCWKNLNYAARFQGGDLEHQDLRRWDTEFVS